MTMSTNGSAPRLIALPQPNAASAPPALEHLFTPLTLQLAANPDYRPARHQLAIDNLLCEMIYGDVRRAMIWVPPRYSKSEMISVHAPSVILTHDPNWQIILASYGSELAFAFGRRARDVFNAYVPHLKLNDSSSAKNHWSVAGYRGGMISSGVGGPITGSGAHWLLIDDPVKNWEDAISPTAREHLFEWWRSVARTRLQADARVLIIQTRWHQDDLSGRILAEAGAEHDWRILRLPAIAEDADDELGREPGEALWPELFPIESLEEIRADVGQYVWNALYQQRPAALEGGLFRVAKIRYAPPEQVRSAVVWYRFWDLATTERTSADYTASIRGFVEDGRVYAADGIRGQWEWPDARREIISTALREGPETQIYIEAVGFQNAAIQELRRLPELSAHTIRGVPVRGDKVSRSQALAARVDAELVTFQRGDWCSAWIEEMRTFPHGANDDCVDALVGMYARASRPAIEIG